MLTLDLRLCEVVCLLLQFSNVAFVVVCGLHGSCVCRFVNDCGFVLYDVAAVLGGFVFVCSAVGFAVWLLLRFVLVIL